MNSGITSACLLGPSSGHSANISNSVWLKEAHVPPSACCSFRDHCPLDSLLSLTPRLPGPVRSDERTLQRSWESLAALLCCCPHWPLSDIIVSVSDYRKSLPLMSSTQARLQFLLEARPQIPSVYSHFQNPPSAVLLLLPSSSALFQRRIPQVSDFLLDSQFSLSVPFSSPFLLGELRCYFVSRCLP